MILGDLRAEGGAGGGALALLFVPDSGILFGIHLGKDRG
jgi:hypothetical protein